MLLGITVAGRYRVEVRSGETVLGPIYSGFDTMDKCPVSIRTLASRFHADRRLARVFRHQIKVAQKLEQEHTARVLAVVDEPGVIGYVTEDLDGVTLRKLMDGGKLDILRTVRIARQVGESLAEAHRKGLIHRDICPSNLMVQTDLFGGDRVKVHGYGISDVRELSMMDSARRGARRTLYIAPEQTRRVRARTGMDLYALGTIMFEAIAGRHPFEDPDPLKVLQLKSSLPAPSLREASTDAPRDLVSLVNGMLATKPSVRRPRSAAELVNQLSDMLTNMSGERHQKLYRESIIANLRSIVAPLPLPLSTQDNQIAVTGRSRSRSKLAPIAWGAAMGIALGAVVALTVDTSPEDAPPEQAAGTVAALAPPQQPPASARAPEAEAAVAEAPREIAEAESASAEAPAEAPSAPVVAEAPAQPAAAPAPALAAEAPAVPAVEAPVAKAAAAPAPAEAAPAPASVVVPEQTGNASLALGHRGVVRVATYSPSGRLLVTGADDRTLHVVDVATGDRVWTLTDLPNTPTALAVSEEAFLIVAGGPDGTLHAWRNGKALGLVHELAGGARTLRFEPGTNHLVAIDQRRGLRRLDTETWERSGPVLRLGRGGPLFSSALSGDGKIVVVVNAGTGRRIVPRDTDKGRVAMELDALPNVLAVATDQTGRWIVTANEAGKLQLIDHGSDIIVKEVDHGGPITALALHPTRGILASGSSDGSVQIWDLAAGKVSHTVPVGDRAITALAFAPGTSDLTVATAGLLQHTLDATTGQRRDVLFGLPTGTAPALAFDQGGKRLATAAGDGGVHFWDVATGRHTGWLQKTGEVRTLVFAGDTLVVGSADGRLSAWRGDKSVWQVDARDAFIALDASTSLVAAASSTLGQVRLFRLADGQELPAPLGRKRDRLGQVRFSDDGHTLAVGSSRGEVALYDVAGTEPRHIRELLRGKGTVLALGWRSDGAVLGASFSRGGLLVYDVGSRKRPPALQRSGMTALPALAVVGNRVVAGALDGSIRGWNHITSQPEASGGRMGELTRWAASSDGRLFAASGPDGAVRIGALEPGALASLSLFAVGQAWVGWTDKGHYDGNKTGIAWLRIEREGKRQAATEIPAMQSATALTQAMRNPGTQTP